MSQEPEPIEDVVEDADDLTQDDDQGDQEDDQSDGADDDTSDDDAGKDGDSATSDDDADDADKSKTAPKKGGVQKRIDALTRKARKAELDAAYYRGLAQGKSLGHTTEDKSQSPPKLDREDFDTEEAYLDAVVDSRIDKRMKERGATNGRDTVVALNAQYDKAREVHEDFDEVALNTTLPITAPMFEAAQGDNLTEILYHLGKNPSLASRISQMTPIRAAMEIGKIEMKLTNTKLKPKPKPRKSDAPEPLPKGPKGGPSPVRTDKSTMKERMNDWEKARLKRLGVTAA